MGPKERREGRRGRVRGTLEKFRTPVGVEEKQTAGGGFGGKTETDLANDFLQTDSESESASVQPLSHAHMLIHKLRATQNTMVGSHLVEDLLQISHKELRYPESHTDTQLSEFDPCLNP
ncbi:unnamed protein product [Pleuronectes platessa]|uniref:Uncharacterized protein n=1 Tax=Pleuronectes platessa TaxID=8262 RepID=A0A9N7U792_PLEPL|nr:unnamed protein product [Pleuronectes platessa]